MPLMGGEERAILFLSRAALYIVQTIVGLPKPMKMLIATYKLGNLMGTMGIVIARTTVHMGFITTALYK